MKAIAKKELRDRNWQRQQQGGYPNIPKGAEVMMAGGYIPKYTSVWWNSRFYTVRSSDLEFDNEAFMAECAAIKQTK